MAKRKKSKNVKLKKEDNKTSKFKIINKIINFLKKDPLNKILKKKWLKIY